MKEKRAKIPKMLAVGLGLLILLSFAVSPVLAKSGTYLKEKDIHIRQKTHTHTDAIEMFGMTIAEETDTYTLTETWISKDKMRTDTYERKDESDMKGQLTYSNYWLKDKMYSVDHRNKTYAEVKLGDLPTMDVTVKVEPTRETEKIGGWKCKKYNVEIKFAIEGMTFTTKEELWACKDIKIDYGKYMGHTQAATSSLFGKDALNEFKKIGGYPVRIIGTTTVMGITTETTTELIEYGLGSTPKGIYEIPRGYKKGS